MDPPFTRETSRPEGSVAKEPFQLLSDTTRLEILHALWEAHDPADPSPLRFSELRERVDADDPGRLNYHLNKLAPGFVRRTEDGYELRESGQRIVRMLLSGTAIEEPVIQPTDLDISCWYCGGATTLRYEDGWRYLTCTSCDARCVESVAPGVISKNEFPPSGLLGRTPREINEADRIWSAHRRAAVMDEVCPECAGRMPVTSIQICDDHDPDWERNQFCEACGSIFWMLVSHVCERCKYSWKLPTLFYPTRHPAVVAFYYEHGIELDLATHEQRALLLDYREELLSEDPLRIRIGIALDGDELELTFDEEMNVVRIDR